MKFGCTVSQIKRLNNLAIDRDLYALSACKIPIIEYSSQWALYEKDIKRVHINDLFWLNTKKLSTNNNEEEVYANSDSDETINLLNSNNNNNNNDDRQHLLASNNSIDSSIDKLQQQNAELQKREAILFFKNIDSDSEKRVKESTNQQKIILETMPPAIQLNNDLNHNHNVQPDSSLCNFKEIMTIGFIVLLVIPGVVYLYMRILNKIV